MPFGHAVALEELARVAVGFLAGAGGAVDREGGERGEGQLVVGGGAGDDEGGGQGEGGGGVERGAEGVGHGDLVDGGALHAGVQGLDGQDGAGGGEVGFACDQGRAREVGRGADALEDGGQGDEGQYVRVREVVGAGRDGRVAGGGDGGGEEGDVGLLVVRDVLQVVVVVGAIARVLEVLLGEVLQGLLVEDVLEMLKLLGKFG